ncbi:hypothetical protein ABCW43_21690 [Neorhizobium sp. IRAMC:178]|uniref:hypothetical protein n=1 Tax=Neorhizobium tunisiense TaxID=3144793 RepID=UPI0031F67BB0
MNRREETRAAVINYLRSVHATPVAPVNLHQVTVALAKANFTQEEIVRALFWLETDHVLELMQGNLVRVMHFMTVDEDASL